MTTHAHRPSATVYDFATRARAILDARGQSEQAASRAARPVPAVDWSGGWYHESAIRDEDRTRKP